MEEKSVVEIDVWKLLSMLWKKKIWIAIVSAAAAVLTAIGALLFSVPKYQADVLFYVNNNSISLGGTSLSFSSGEITAARQMLDSYVVALQSRTCLDRVIEKADLPYTREELSEMITTKSVNNTEWFRVKVESEDPEEAQVIANTIADVLPDLLSSTIKGSTVEVVDRAIKPVNKVSPGVSTYAFYGFIGGFLLIVGAFIVAELLNDKVHNEETIPEISKSIPVLANIPHKRFGSASAKYGSEYGTEKQNTIQRSNTLPSATALCGELDFAAAEAYKLLQTSVEYSFENSGCKLIGVTSSQRNEGKSTVAVNLAYMLSCDKKRVLLLEGDMRLPSIAQKLGIESAPGLSDYLTGRIQNQEGIQHTEKAPGLSIVCAGVVPPNPFGLLGSSAMEKFLSELKVDYDYIIVDLPPVNIVSDPLAVAKYLDGFIISVRSDYTTKKGVRDVIEKLRVVNSDIVGFVVHSVGSYSETKYGKYGKYGKNAYQNKDYESSYEHAARKADSSLSGRSSANSGVRKS